MGCGIRNNKFICLSYQNLHGRGQQHNYYKLQYNNAVDGAQLKKSADGSTWTDYNGDNSAQGRFELSECVTYEH
jgi:hypothetical protein